jgi:hypothetical protein
MTITLHWWMVPLCLAASGLYLWSRPSRGWQDYGDGAVGAVLFVVALAICIGYVWGAP